MLSILKGANFLSKSILFVATSVNLNVLCVGGKRKDGGPCWCKSSKCMRIYRNRTTLRSHAKKDYGAIKESQLLNAMESPRLSGCSFDPNLYIQHSAAQLKLYENSKLSQLDYIFVEFRKFVSHPTYAKSTVTENFRTDSKFKLPQPNNCPHDFTHAKHIIKDFLVPLTVYHVCPNDCVIFRNNFADATECPICKSSRYEGNGKARKVFKYLPLTPRIARIFQDTNLAQLLQVHSQRTSDGMLRDILDTDTWKVDWFSSEGEFRGDSGIALNFCTDGVNPHKTLGYNYSMWPMMMSVLNFPMSFRKSVGGILLLGIIPGNGRKEAFHIDPYISITVDELLLLADCHVYYPSYMKAPVKVQAKLLQYVLDFPGIAKLLKLPGSGAIKACPWCDITGQYCKTLCKTLYLDNKCFLPENSILRDSTNFANELHADDPLTPTLSAQQELGMRKEYDKLPTAAAQKRFARKYGVKGSYSLMELPYHRFHEHVQPDSMHTFKDVLDHIINLLIGGTQSEKLERAEEEMRSSKRRRLGETVTVMTADEVQRGNARCSNLKFPYGCSAFKGYIFTKPKQVLKKTHGWTEYTKYNIWSYLIRDCLPEKQRKSLVYFFWVLAQLHANIIHKDDIPGIVKNINTALALLETDYPVTLNNITTHILRHIAEKIASNGPLPASWMYPFERMNCFITRRAMNKAMIEQCIMETIQILDWVLFSTHSGQFSSISDGKNVLCAAGKRVLSREGDLNSLSGYTAKKFKLNNRQQESAGLESSDVKSYRLMDKTNLEEDDITYQVGDYVAINGELFGKITSLLDINCKLYADVKHFTHVSKDPITCLFYADLEGPTIERLVELTNLTNPLVTAREEEYIWFVSYIPSSLPWLEQHLSEC